MLLFIEYLVLFGPALMFAGMGLAMFPIGLIIGSQGMLLAAIPVMVIELFSLFGLYACFQLVRKRIEPATPVAKPRVILVQILCGFIAVVAFGLMEGFYQIGWHLYLLLAPIMGAGHLVFINRGYLFSAHS